MEYIGNGFWKPQSPYLQYLSQECLTKECFSASMGGTILVQDEEEARVISRPSPVPSSPFRKILLTRRKKKLNKRNGAPIFIWSGRFCFLPVLNEKGFGRL